MKLFDELKEVFHDPSNRGTLKVLKWLAVLLCLGGFKGGLGILLALLIIFCWKLPEK